MDSKFPKLNSLIQQPGNRKTKSVLERDMMAKRSKGAIVVPDDVTKYQLTMDTITHMFLPKRTPEKLQTNLEDIEESMLKSFNDSIIETLAEYPILEHQLSSTKLMFQKWIDIQPKSDNLDRSNNLWNEIILLENGETLPIYVRNQNSTLLISKREDETFCVATYRSSLNNEAVMSTVGSHSVRFPETSETIRNIEMIQSEEFVKQIYELAVGDIEISLPKTTKGGAEFKETRDIANPHLVSDWIVGLLVPAEESQHLTKDILVTKKIRDQVTFITRASGSLPFRRSGMYMSMKVALQLKLLENLDNDQLQAKYIFKLLMLRIFSQVALDYFNHSRILKKVDLDLSSQILAKLGTRIKKLDDCFDGRLKEREIYEETELLKNESLEFTKSVVHQLKNYIQTAWYKVYGQQIDNGFLTAEKNDEFAKNTYDYYNDLEHQIPLLNSFVGALKTSSYELTGGITLCFDGIESLERYTTASSILSLSSSFIPENKLRIWLFDTENFIKNCSSSDIEASVISKILQKYFSNAQQYYKNNPVGMSQMFLVTLRGFSLIDKITTKMYPLMSEYKLEINPEIFEYLILPYEKDMKLLEELNDYFVSRDQAARRSVCGVLSRDIDHNSFTVRYASCDENMKSLRERILTKIEQDVQSKMRDVEKTREQCRKMQSRIDTEICRCEFHETKRYKRWGKWFRLKISTCETCRLKPLLRNSRTSVSYYERTLPADETLQWAVVFELAIPSEFAIWRDFFAFFKYEILGQPIFNGESNGSLPMQWLNYSGLKIHTSNSSMNLSLGSSSLPSSNTHYTKENLDVLIYTSNESYIIHNGMNCHFNYKTVGTATKCVKKACTFQINDTSNNESYKTLQNELLSTSHTQNQILARQYNCHQKLSLHEFIAFGSLRAGHRIQLRNLFEAIHSGTLSLEEEPVLALILQTIWQVGPRNAEKIRESHLDFENNDFAGEFMELLDNLVKINDANYSNSLIVLTAVIVGRRIADLNSVIDEKCYLVLKKWRIVLKKWIAKIQEELDKNDPAITVPLKINLSEIIMSLLFSYDISSHSKLETVIKDEDDIVDILDALHHYNQNMKENDCNMSTFMRTLLKVAQNIPLRLEIQRKVFMAENNMYQNGIRRFIASQWNKASMVQFKKMESKDGHTICVEYLDNKTGSGEVYRLTFDLFMGSFLVNGNSQQILPMKVRNHKLFQLYFKDESNLRVQQDSNNVTRTAVRFHGKHYEFHQNVKINYLPSGRSFTSPSYQISKVSRMNSYYDSDSSENLLSDDDDYIDRNSYSSNYSSPFRHSGNTDVVIKEIQDDGNTFILLDPECFQNCLSDYFIRSYTHWLDLEQCTVYFRPMSGYEKPYEYELRLDQSTETKIWKLFDIQKKAFVLSIDSKGFKYISSFLSRLEHENYINVTLDKGTGDITAFLRRYNLKFMKKGSSSPLLSVEYPGFSISHVQGNHGSGTLLGLQQGLLMENNGRRLLLVPHSSIKIKKYEPHQNSVISLTTLQKPPCFVYEFDDVLKRLKAHNSKAAWLYLAALHASTSSQLPDPFTDITGTEMAVRILQSASIWACAPYDDESLSILNFIKNLSPKRKYYGKSKNDMGSMEIVEWPEGLPSMAAYDGFALIVEKLLEDSSKLSMLYNSSNSNEIFENGKSTYSDRLQIRAYSRYLAMYNPAVFVQNPKYFKAFKRSLLTADYSMEKTFPLRNSTEKLNLSNLSIISYCRLENTIMPLVQGGYFQKNNLAIFLLQKDKSLDAHLPGLSLDEPSGFCDFLFLDFHYNWLKLYKMAISCKTREESNLYTLILSALAYRGAPMDQIANLHCISIYASNDASSFPNVPNSADNSSQSALENLSNTINSESENYCYLEPTSYNYEISKIEAVLNNNAKDFTALEMPKSPISPGCHSFYFSSEVREEYTKKQEEYVKKKEEYEKDLKQYMAQKAAYENKIKISCKSISSELGTKYWPCGKIETDELIQLLEAHDIKAKPTIKEINTYLEYWFKNYQLKLFIEKVEGKLGEIFDLLQTVKSTSKEELRGFQSLLPKNTVAFLASKDPVHIGLDDLIDQQCVANTNIEEIKVIFRTGKWNASEKKKYEQKAEELKNCLLRLMTGNVSTTIINMTGISPRLDPISILGYILEKNDSNAMNLLKNYAGALGVLWSHIKRCNRLARAQNTSDVERERLNPGHENWSPADHPDWLLLELELDIMIRPIQVQVANQMITMPKYKNGVTQLNMGEGKTSVIVPMLCSTLAKQNTQLCRVTVLSSMFKMNLNSLTFSIGGLLNRRVYSIPCRRDMEIDEKCVAKIKEIYKECLKEQGVVLTLPEYRLSFRLLAYDKILKNESALGLAMIGIENFLRQFSRDVLDESDELFSVKYQLVYTTGDRKDIDGKDMRWVTCQEVLAMIHKIGSKLQDKYGTSAVEVDQNVQATNPHEFSTLRLISESYFTEFVNTLADEYLKSVTIAATQKKIVKRFLVDQDISIDEHNNVINSIFKEEPEQLKKIVLISGYLRRGVLCLALTKRWRVEYGVNPKQGFRRMAVPFRAKDVAAEKTEFGHPDLAIILTHLSYYYSGLDDTQLQEVFDILKGEKQPEATYSSWVSPDVIPTLPDSLKKYHSLNMKDATQKRDLFKILRKHKLVVNFWLSHCVFPQECKQFSGKLVMTAWDLCYERQQFPVTGFSGTKDSKILLPLMISQQDLEKLKNTDDEMKATLLRPENTNHKGFEMAVTCSEILKSMKQDNLKVLIDAGALMLECSNEQVADLWLEVDSDMEAIVYFSKENELLVKCREELKFPGIPFDVSPYQGRLDKCGIFLDDQHTRGTDLKFLEGSNACVTVGARMKRDKLIQACMRMRKLGKGHSVTFYLSHDAHAKVMPNKESVITTQAVLDWVNYNKDESNKDGLLYWALAARNYAQRLVAEDIFHYPNHLSPFQVNTEDNNLSSNATILANQCEDTEIVELMEMYGQFTQTEKLTELIPKWFSLTKRKLQRKNDGRTINERIVQKYDEFCKAVQDRCVEHIPNKTHVSSNSGMMEEEQEKELELEKETEVEEEKIEERPGKAQPAQHSLHACVKQVVLNGSPLMGFAESGGSIMRLCEVFKTTTFWNEVQPDCWNGDVFVTTDFASTIAGSLQTDSYLRPIQYIVSCKLATKANGGLLILSPFEVNELLPHFQSGIAQTKLLMFSLRRTEKQDLLLNRTRLQLPALQQAVVIPEDSLANISLLLASGSLYFINDQEQSAYINFLGLAPKPWSDKENEAFENGMITKSGFLLPEHRLSLLGEVGVPLSSEMGVEKIMGFNKDPSQLVKIILEKRHPVVSPVTHVRRLLEQKRRVEFAP